ncbi:AAA family ATPase [Bacteroides nordii]|uniref:AAA family ATPase n=1 Tax=Bacteroides nordii TaxID=291645 RepID=UPI00203BF476|nr:ATP-binding protein [Bacteroides nordii]GFZ41706.1 hypothetical protein BANORC5_37410 [Bacteroides nordii]
MLTKFAVQNYRGFAERIEFNLSNPANYEFNKNAIKNGIIKSGIVYGPNGSGKTNFSLAIFDIENHLSQKWKKGDYYLNFIYAGKKDSTVDFEYTFKFDNDIIQYNYSKNANGILISEMLKVGDVLVFDRNINSFFINDSLFPMDDSIKHNFSKNANNVSVINFLLTSYPLEKDNYLIKLQQFVGSMLWFRNLDVREFIGLETSVTMLDEYIISNNLLDDFEDFLKKVSNQIFHLVSDSSKQQILCEIDDTLIPFHLIASTGTKSLQLLYFWIKRMNKDASFVFIDEFDAFYHFQLSTEVCRRLFNLECQVFATSHNTHLMTNDLLRPDCNFILDKNKIISLSKLTDKELREAHNIEKIYKSGAFYVE